MAIKFQNQDNPVFCGLNDKNYILSDDVNFSRKEYNSSENDMYLLVFEKISVRE